MGPAFLTRSQETTRFDLVTVVAKTCPSKSPDHASTPGSTTPSEPSIAPWTWGPGVRDRASGAKFCAPAMWCIVKLHLPSLSARCSRRGLSMSPSSSFVNSPSSGLWSTRIIRSAHPRVHCLVFSSAHTTANNSPSIGWYLDSAGVQYLLPHRIIAHPEAQHVGCTFLQAQRFCHKTYPTPLRLQSIMRHVRAPNLKDLTPRRTSSTIPSLATSKDFCSSWFHTNAESFFSRLRNGSIKADLAKA